MNAISPPPLAVSDAAASANVRVAEAPANARARSASWQLPAILTVFWIYVMISNVLYAQSMSASFDPEGSHHFFARWDARALQHLFLYPALCTCIWASLRIGWRPVWLAWPIQLALGLTFSALAAPLLWAGEMLMSGDKEPMEHTGPWSLSGVLADVGPHWIASATSFLLTYGFAVALTTGFSLYRRYRDSELRLAALERAWNGARLAALRMQLSPHTLFNLLHTIRGEIGWDPAAAQSMIVQLADLLRKLLNAGEQEFSRLTQELEFAQLYLRLQQKRFADRLIVTLPDPEAAPCAWVPSLILQPLIENAVVHGLSAGARTVEVHVAVEQSDDTLILRVSNTGAASGGAVREGIGLANVRERLKVHFGTRAQLAAGPSAPESWVAEIRMPLLTEAAWRAASAEKAVVADPVVAGAEGAQA